MIETSPRTPLPVLILTLDGNTYLWDGNEHFYNGNKSYLDGNTALWKPQQLKYLDGNNTWIKPYITHLESKYLEYQYENKFVEAFNFAPSSDKIVASESTTNDPNFVIDGYKISYKTLPIDLSKDIQYVNKPAKYGTDDLIVEKAINTDLIVLKAKTHGYYVWTTQDSFGDFKINNGLLQQHIDQAGTDHTFVNLFPKNRQYNLISRTQKFYESKGDLISKTKIPDILEVKV